MDTQHACEQKQVGYSKTFYVSFLKLVWKTTGINIFQPVHKEQLCLPLLSMVSNVIDFFFILMQPNYYYFFFFSLKSKQGNTKTVQKTFLACVIAEYIYLENIASQKNQS